MKSFIGSKKSIVVAIVCDVCLIVGIVSYVGKHSFDKGWERGKDTYREALVQKDRCIGDLKAEISDLNMEIADLKTEVRDLNIEIGEFEKSNSEMREYCEGFMFEADSLRKENRKIQSENQKIKDDRQADMIGAGLVGLLLGL